MATVVIDNTDKINSLKNYVEVIKRQLNSPPERHQVNLETYTAWANLEIKRTLAKIAELTA